MEPAGKATLHDLCVSLGRFAASSLLLGYLLAERGLSNRTIGLIMGFGAGALISAIAYELVPESAIGGWEMPAAFALGAAVFFSVDWLVDRMGGVHRKSIAGKKGEGSGAAIFIGTLLDAIPTRTFPLLTRDGLAVHPTH